MSDVAGRTFRPIFPVKEADQQRFWNFVCTKGDCWIWTGPMVKGRGRFTLSRASVLAPRVAFALAHGRDPTGFVCHSCDNPACVKPAHLWEGDNQANMADASAKGRLGNKGRTHCRNGHELTAETMADKGDHGICCRVCLREAQQRYDRKNRERRREKRRALALGSASA